MKEVQRAQGAAEGKKWKQRLQTPLPRSFALKSGVGVRKEHEIQKKVLLSFKDKYRAYFLACEEGVSRTWLKIREDRRQNDRARSQRSG